MLLSHEGHKPTVHESAVVAPTAVLCGDVTVGAGCQIGFGAVAVAEGQPIRLGSRVIVRDNVVIRSSRAHAEELRRALNKLADDFDAWKAGSLRVAN